MSSPYHVEFLTWNTDLDRAQGLGAGVDSMAQGTNLGHASVEISLPYTDVTQQWIEQYCKNIQLYKPPEALRREDDTYEANIPVYYTTVSGKPVYNPKKYLQEYPQEQIVTHVYLSWVPGRAYAAQRDARDPFMGEGKRSFRLYDNKQDKIMEHEGHNFPFARDYQGLQQIELTEGELPGTTQYINRGVRDMYRMTPMQVKLMEMTPKQRFIADLVLDKIYSELKKHKEPEVFLNEFRVYVEKLAEGKNEKALLKNFKEDIAQHYGLIKDMNVLLLKIYCHDNEIDRNLSPAQKRAIRKKFNDTFSLENLGAVLESMHEIYDKIELVQKERDLHFFQPIYKSLAQSTQPLQEFVHVYPEIKENMARIDAALRAEQPNLSQEMIIQQKNKMLNEILKQNPCLEIMLQRFVEDSPDEANNSWEFIYEKLGAMLEQGLQLEDEIILREQEARFGMEADQRILLPIANIDEINFKEGHPEGLNVLQMLKAIPRIVADGQGYNLDYKNCSDFAQAFGKAGAPEHLKPIFDRYALGMYATPQIVANGATRYAKILYDENYQPGQYKQTVLSKIYQNAERKVAAYQKRYEILQERIKGQDAWIENILDNFVDFEDTRYESLYNKVVASELHSNFMGEDALKNRMEKLYKKTHDKTDLKKADDINRQLANKEGTVYQAAVKAQLKDLIFAYANQEYAKALEEDKQRVYRDITNQTGLFEFVTNLDPNPLTEQAIKDEMRKIAKAPIKVSKEFDKKGEIYKKACHHIIYRHAPGIENLMDPAFVSMEQDRKDATKYHKTMMGSVSQLVFFRSIYSVFKNPENVQSVWYEVDFARRATAYGISKIPDDLMGGVAKLAAHTVRFALLATVGAVHGVLIAPRRAASKWLKGVREKLFAPSQKSLVKKSDEQRFLDPKFMEKVTFDEKTQQNIHRHQAITQSLVNSNQDQAVLVSAKQAQNALRQANDILEQQKIPYFDDKTERKILKEVAKVSAVLMNIERKEDNLFSKKLDHKLNQFEMVTKARLSEHEFQDDADTFDYQPQVHGPVIPEDIQRTNDPDKVRDFFKNRIREHLESNRIAEGIKFLTETEIDRFSDKQLFAAVRRMSSVDFLTQLNIDEKRLMDELTKNPQSTLFEFNIEQPSAFKAYLKNKGWKASLLELLESKGMLPNLLTRLQYAQVSAMSVQKMVRLAKEQVPQKAQQSKQSVSRAKPIATRLSQAYNEQDLPLPKQPSADRQSPAEQELTRRPSHRPKT